MVLLTVNNLVLGFLIVSPYIAFVFFGESLHPFTKPRAHTLRPIWRYGRWMALAVLLRNLIAIGLMVSAGFPLLKAALCGVAVLTVLGSLIAAKRMTSLLKQ